MEKLSTMGKAGLSGMSGAIVLLTTLYLIASYVDASPARDDQSLDRGAIEDVTPQQKYRSAIREAGGAYKESLRECAGVGSGDRQACTREAKETYDRDMAEAKRLLLARDRNVLLRSAVSERI